MHSSTLDLFEDKADDENAREFSLWVKERAEELNITEDYFLLEFI